MSRSIEMWQAYSRARKPRQMRWIALHDFLQPRGVSLRVAARGGAHIPTHGASHRLAAAQWADSEQQPSHGDSHHCVTRDAAAVADGKGDSRAQRRVPPRHYRSTYALDRDRSPQLTVLVYLCLPCSAKARVSLGCAAWARPCTSPSLHGKGAHILTVESHSAHLACHGAHSRASETSPSAMYLM